MQFTVKIKDFTHCAISKPTRSEFGNAFRNIISCYFFLNAADQTSPHAKTCHGTPHNNCCFSYSPKENIFCSCDVYDKPAGKEIIKPAGRVEHVYKSGSETAIVMKQ